MKPTRMIAGHLEADHRRRSGRGRRSACRPGRCIEMPMTTAPMRPTVPALRPFFDRPPASAPDVGGAAAPVAGSAHARAPSSAPGAVRALLRVRGTTTIGTGSSCSIFAAVEPRKRRRGCARRLEPTTASSPGSQPRWATASSMLSPRATTTSASTPSGSASSALPQHVVGVGGAGDADDAGVDARRAGRPRRARAAAARRRSRWRARRSRRAARSAPGRVPIAAVTRRDAGGRVDPPRALGREHDGHVGGVQQLGGDGAEPVAAAESAVGGADDDVRCRRARARPRQALGERVAEPHVRAVGHGIRNRRRRLGEPRLGLLLQVAVVAGIRRGDDAAVLARAARARGRARRRIARGEPRAECDRVGAGIRGGVADDDVSRSSRGPPR